MKFCVFDVQIKSKIITVYTIACGVGEVERKGEEEEG